MQRFERKGLQAITSGPYQWLPAGAYHELHNICALGPRTLRLQDFCHVIAIHFYIPKRSSIQVLFNYVDEARQQDHRHFIGSFQRYELESYLTAVRGVAKLAQDWRLCSGSTLQSHRIQRCMSSNGKLQQTLTEIYLDRIYTPTFSYEAFLQSRLARFFTGAQVRLLARRVLQLRSRVTALPALLQHAWLITLLNGWSTAARFQDNGPCVFGCANQKCSLEHYLVCPSLWPVISAHFSFPLGPSPAQRLCLRVDDDLFDSYMLSLAIAFRTFCRFRFGRRQPIDEAVRGVLRDILTISPIRRGRLKLA